MVKHTLATLLIIPLAAIGQVNVLLLDSNVSDLNPERDAISGLVGTWRISHRAFNAGEPVNFNGASFPVTLLISHRTDGWTNRVVASFDGSEADNLLRWQFNLPDAGPYELKASAIYPDDEFPILWRYLSVTNLPVGDAVINIESNAVQVTVPVTNILQSTLIINLEGNTVAEIVQP